MFPALTRGAKLVVASASGHKSRELNSGNRTRRQILIALDYFWMVFGWLLASSYLFGNCF